MCSPDWDNWHKNRVCHLWICFYPNLSLTIAVIKFKTSYQFDSTWNGWKLGTPGDTFPSVRFTQKPPRGFGDTVIRPCLTRMPSAVSALLQLIRSSLIVFCMSLNTVGCWASSFTFLSKWHNYCQSLMKSICCLGTVSRFCGVRLMTATDLEVPKLQLRYEAYFWSRGTIGLQS